MEIKGIKEGILVTLEEQEWQDAKDALIGKIKEKGDFFKGAQLVFDVGNMVLGANELGEVCDLLMAHDVILHGVISKSLVTQKVAKEMGLVTKVEKPRLNSEQKLKPLETVFTGEPAIFIHRTLRSGFKVAYQGHVIVLGDVNPGAEIIATGSVVVWGRLRGTVHAGAEGDQAAVVCALDLSPTQLRIASKITTTPQEQVESKPEIASIVDGQIIAEPWKH
ncbi:MAG: septum site-determining protein MinC [Brevefilum sp.]|nr:septum site-determining protein MinC [Brevefilum sp.]